MGFIKTSPYNKETNLLKCPYVSIYVNAKVVFKRSSPKGRPRVRGNTRKSTQVSLMSSPTWFTILLRFFSTRSGGYQDFICSVEGIFIAIRSPFWVPIEQKNDDMIS